ncbi:S41 family peptidase [Arsukibacterium sp.]|uniref:S41 family peptidase n=1 Tax=Arsukibacterium sp. TaxID=1977258 RepID=UPI00299D07E9|nr:S41 family peptidase [Arsukibacterium sp.]MDX1678057.1 S41 family peptidase [Arsukibacterium sp.]
MLYQLLRRFFRVCVCRGSGLALLISLSAAAGPTPDMPLNNATEKVYSSKQLQQDFQQLYRDLQRGSYHLFAHYPKQAYDQQFTDYLALLNKPMSKLQAHKHFMQFVALASIAHTRIDFPVASYRAFIDADGKTLPLSLNINGDDITVAEYYGADPRVQPGQRLLSINGIASREFLQPLQAYLAADNAALLDGLTGSQLAPLLWLHHAEQLSYTLSLQQPGSDARYQLQQATLNQTEQAKNSAANRTANKAGSGSSEPRQYRILADTIGYLQPGPFYNVYATNDAEVWDTTEFHAFIDQAFGTFVAAGVHSIIIDLRDNPGGTNSFSDHMLAWFADKPFRFASDFRVKVSALSRAANRARMPEEGEPDAITRQLEQFYRDNQEGAVISFPLQNTPPHRSEQNIAASDIKVFVLIGRHSYSNAVSVAAIAQDYNFATVIGQPTADLATTYGAMETFTLSHTGIVVGYPKALIIRPNGDAKPAGVTPDVLLDLPADNKAALQQLIDYINADSR